MKFAALALALLLAVGSHAASVQADAPTQLEHARAALDVYLTQVKDMSLRAVNQLDDPQYAEFKTNLAQRIEEMYTQIKTLQSSVSPMTDSFYSTVMEVTKDTRESLSADIQALKTSLEPQREKLREVIERHLNDYRTMLTPIYNDYKTKHDEEMTALKARLEPVMDELHAKVRVNLEETKGVLMPMVDTVSTKVHERLTSLREVVQPYVQEYKEQMKQMYDQAQNVDTEALKTQITPLVEEIKVKMNAIFEIIAASVTKH
ncbi:apolipoprotein A-Ib [Pagrus major]|uniref:apolipoprotein A-Ib n=1 Tax=Pagrus major TaxID=143350 RepID=UPI003CC8B5B5